jgi:hypothetical protein
MKKSKLLIVGLIGLLLAVGMILAGCDKDCAGGCYADETTVHGDYCDDPTGTCPYFNGEYSDVKCPC